MEKELKRTTGMKVAKVSAEKGMVAPMTFLTLAEATQAPKYKNLQMVLPNAVVLSVCIHPTLSVMVASLYKRVMQTYGNNYFGAAHFRLYRTFCTKRCAKLFL